MFNSSAFVFLKKIFTTILPKFLVSTRVWTIVAGIAGVISILPFIDSSPPPPPEYMNCKFTTEEEVQLAKLHRLLNSTGDSRFEESIKHLEEINSNYTNSCLVAAANYNIGDSFKENGEVNKASKYLTATRVIFEGNDNKRLHPKGRNLTKNEKMIFDSLLYAKTLKSLSQVYVRKNQYSKACNFSKVSKEWFDFMKKTKESGQALKVIVKSCESSDLNEI